MTFRIEKPRFYVDEKIYQEIKNTGSALEITVNPSTGKHKKGVYTIPNNVAITFIESKRDAFNWINNGNYHQDGVPTVLRAYFKEV